MEKPLQEQGLTWADALPALEMIDSIDDLHSAVHDPVRFLQTLADKSQSAARRLAVAKLRRVILLNAG